MKEEDVNINAAVLEMVRDSEQPPTLPEVGDLVEVTVSHVTATGDIYVQLVGPGMVRLRHVMAELEDFYDGKVSGSRSYHSLSLCYLFYLLYSTCVANRCLMPHSLYCNLSLTTYM